MRNVVQRVPDGSGTWCMKCQPHGGGCMPSRLVGTSRETRRRRQKARIADGILGACRAARLAVIETDRRQAAIRQHEGRKVRRGTQQDGLAVGKAQNRDSQRIKRQHPSAQRFLEAEPRHAGSLEPQTLIVNRLDATAQQARVVFMRWSAKRPMPADKRNRHCRNQRQ